MYTTSQQARESNAVEHRKPAHAFVWIRLITLLSSQTYNVNVSFACCQFNNITKEGKNLT